MSGRKVIKEWQKLTDPAWFQCNQWSSTASTKVQFSCWWIERGIG
jgi:hypothetical protein